MKADIESLIIHIRNDLADCSPFRLHHLKRIKSDLTDILTLDCSEITDDDAEFVNNMIYHYGRKPEVIDNV